MHRWSGSSLVSLVAVASALALPACAAEADDAGGEPATEVDESEANAVAPAWYRVRSVEHALFLEPANGGEMTCADGTSSARCPLVTLDLRRLGLEPEARARVEALAQEDVVLAHGRAVPRRIREAKQLRLVATRLFENLLRVTPQGDLYEVTRLPQPTTCTLARELPSPRGVLAPPAVETFEGTCLHHVRKLGSPEAFDLDEPNWASRASLLPQGAAEGVLSDLAANEPVVVNGRWLSRERAPLSRPAPVQIWRDVTRAR